jgi:hypothetical protein
MIYSKTLRFFSTAALVVGFSTLAHAQATRTWVSGVGDDANPCSRTAPCKTFPGAISKTAAGGEINVLDPGGFGAVTITKSITIRSDSIEAGVLVSAGNAINVNATATDRVVLEGLDIEGLGTSTDGVKVNSAAIVEITRCSIRHFAGNGVNVVSSTANTRVVILDSILSFNAGGVNVLGTGGVANSATIMSSFLDGNTSFGVQANGAVNAISLIRTNILGSPAGISSLNSAPIASFGPSNVITGTGAPTVSPVFK